MTGHLFDSTSLLEESLNDLKNDINSVDAKLSDLDQLILDLKNSVSRAQQMLSTAPQSDKVNLYRVINASMDTLASYYQVYTKFMELKFRYRSEVGSTSFKGIHLVQIELRKMGDGADASYMDMVELLKKLSTATNSSNSKDTVLPASMTSEIQALDDDDIYRTD